MKKVLGKAVLMILTMYFLRFVVETSAESLLQMPGNLVRLGFAILAAALALRVFRGKDIEMTRLVDGFVERKEVVTNEDQHCRCPMVKRIGPCLHIIYWALP